MPSRHLRPSSGREPGLPMGTLGSNSKCRTTFCGKPVCVCVIQRVQHRNPKGDKREEYI